MYKKHIKKIADSNIIKVDFYKICQQSGRCYRNTQSNNANKEGLETA